MACLRGLPARSSVRMFADATARRFLAEARRLTRLRTILACLAVSSEALHDKQRNQANDERDHDMVELDSIEHAWFPFMLYSIKTEIAMLHKIRQHNYYWLLTRAAMIVLLIAGFFVLLGLSSSTPQAISTEPCPAHYLMLDNHCVPAKR